MYDRGFVDLCASIAVDRKGQAENSSSLERVPRLEQAMVKPTVIFDTSALNKLTDDSESTSLLAGLRSSFTIRLTGTNVEEIAATSCAQRRQDLLNYCKRLLSAGDCIGPHSLVLEALLKRFSEATVFDWKTVDVRFREYEEEIARQEIVDDELAKEQRDHARASQDEFVEIFGRPRPAFEDLFRGGAETRPATFPDLVHRLQVRGGAFWSFGIELCGGVTKNQPDEETIRKLLDECPPFRCIMLAICLAQYERCIREPNSGPWLRAGRSDLFMSVYLPYCDQFITEDPAQQRCLAEIASMGKVDVAVRSYGDFRTCLLVA
jgi:hypothetical protein